MVAPSRDTFSRRLQPSHGVGCRSDSTELSHVGARHGIFLSPPREVRWPGHWPNTMLAADGRQAMATLVPALCLGARRAQHLNSHRANSPVARSRRIELMPRRPDI